jgi:hypothetical protein
MVVGIFTAVLALANIVTGILIWWQSYTAWMVANDSREQARAALQFTGIQTIAGPAAETGEITTGLMSTFQNFGGSRAIGVRAWQSIAYYDGSIPNNADFSKPLNEVKDTGFGVLGPGTTMSIAPLRLTNPDDIVKATDRKGIIVIWGNVSYRDLIEPRVEHVISFCQQVSPTKGTGGITIFGTSPLRNDCNYSK